MIEQQELRRLQKEAVEKARKDDDEQNPVKEKETPSNRNTSEPQQRSFYILLYTILRIT